MEIADPFCLFLRMKYLQPVLLYPFNKSSTNAFILATPPTV